MKTMYSVSEFCREHGISRALFYTLLRKGQAPHVIKAGRRTLISHEAAEDWRLSGERRSLPKKEAA
jgi:hypothetical protein